MIMGPSRRPVVEALEPRILYSADLVPGLMTSPAGGPPALAEQNILSANPSASASLREIAFIDGTLADAALLRDDLAAQRDAGRSIEVIVIGAGEDGLQRIAGTLAGRTGIDAIHLFGHGSPGELQLGTGRLDASALFQNAAAIAGWGAAFTAEADILIYGCDLAGTAQGIAVVDGLAALTGADVAASDDATGAPQRDADWDLEYQQGSIAALIAPGVRAQQLWTTALATTQVVASADTYIDKGSTGLNYGASTSLWIDRSGGAIGNQRILLQFDFGSLPTGATITSATLQMQARYFSGDGDDSVGLNVYEVTQSWGEGNGNGSIGINGATWNQRQLLSPWNQSGGSYNTTPTASLNTSSTGQHSWNVTSLVQAWFSGTKTNNGLIVGSPDSGGDSFRYDSREGATPPQLVIAYTVPNQSPVITSNGGGATAAVTIAEGTTAVTTMTANDPDGTTPNYTISGGADAARFTIDATTGALRFAIAPNFETPQDANGDNVYDVTVSATDGLLADTQALAVTVTNVNEAPVITSNGGGAAASITVASGTTVVTTVAAADPDATTPAYSITGGADAIHFSLDSVTGALRFLVAPTDLIPLDADFDNVYEVTVTASDGSLSDSQALSVTVRDFNVAPMITSNGGGATAAIIIAEGSGAVTTVAATDPEGTSPSYVISGGADAAQFAIDGATGALRFNSPRDFETPADADGDNVYEVVVSASDGSLSDSQALSVTVTNVDETPVISSNGGGTTAAVTVAEGSTAVTTVAATDSEGAIPVYAISGGADAARFTINATTGALRFATAPNFETPQDANGDNVYDVTVTATDGLLADTHGLAVTVTNVNEAPVITLPSGGSTTANATLSVIGLSVSDVDAAAGTIRVTLSVGSGTLLVNADIASGVPATGIAGNGTASVTLTGTLAAINRSLEGDGNGITFAPAPGYIGIETLVLTADDLGNSGSGQGLSASTSLAIAILPGAAPESALPAAPTTPAEAVAPPAAIKATPADEYEPVPAVEPAADAAPALPSGDTEDAGVAESLYGGGSQPANTTGFSGFLIGRDSVSAAVRNAGVVGAAVPAAFAAPQFFGATLLSPADLGEALQRVDFVSQLDALRRTIEVPAAYEKQLAGVSAATTLSLSAGYVLWLLRGGVLLSSLIASLPAWQLLDPLPVLRNAAEADDDEYAGDDDVESVFSSGASPPSPAPEKSAASADIPPAGSKPGNVP